MQDSTKHNLIYSMTVTLEHGFQQSRNTVCSRIVVPQKQLNFGQRISTMLLNKPLMNINGLFVNRI